MRKIPLAGIELTSQRVRGLRGTSELPGRPAYSRKKCTRYCINTVVNTGTGELKRLNMQYRLRNNAAFFVWLFLQYIGYSRGRLEVLYMVEDSFLVLYRTVPGCTLLYLVYSMEIVQGTM